MTARHRARSSARPGAEAYFGERAAFYDAHYDRLDGDGYALRSRMAATLLLAGTGPGAALDAGMGPGRLCSELDACGWTVSGVDASVEMVEVARARLPRARQRLLRARIETLPFDDGSFDLVTATGVLEFSDVQRALRELARVVRPGGQAVLSYPNPRALYGIWKGQLWYPAVRATKRLLRRRHADAPRSSRAVSPEAFATMLEEVGLVPNRVVYASFMPLPAPADQLLPRVSARLGTRLDGRGGATARLLATQVVYSASKPARP